MKTKSKIDYTTLFFILPAFLLYTLIVIYPSLDTIRISFTNWDGVNPEMRFIGLQNYRSILTSERFWNAVKNTVILGLGTSIIVNVISLAVALLLDQVKHCTGFFRTLVYLPGLISGFVTATIWRLLLNYNFGLVNIIFERLGLDFLRNDWLGDRTIVIWTILFIMCFTLGGNTMLIYLANLQSIPQELLDAAVVDGCSRRQKFVNVVWPMLAGAVTVNITLFIIGGWAIFDTVMILTGGGPGFASETMAFFIYTLGFGGHRAGYGSAAAVILFIIVMVSTLISNKFLRSREE